MPVYNAEKFLEPALNSILQQTYKNIEIIAVNDGSTDTSLSILESSRDRRVKIINNSKNMKLVRSLNIGIQASSGDFIVRMDADDIASTERIELQLKYMTLNPDIAVLGSWFEFMDTNTLVKFPSDSDDIRNRLFYFNSVGHPTAMINRGVVGNDLYYSETHEYAEDYELWNRLSQKYRIENLKKNLLKYRVHPSQISSALVTPQNRVVDEIRVDNLRRLGVAGDDKNLKILAQIFNESKLVPPQQEAIEFGQYLAEQNKLLNIYPRDSFEQFIQISLGRKRASIFQPRNKILFRLKGIVKKMKWLS